MNPKVMGMITGEHTLAALEFALPSGFELRHRDRIPRALFSRVVASLGSFVNLVDPSLERSVGVVERAGAVWDDASLERLRPVFTAFFGKRVIPVREPSPATPQCPVLALIELFSDDGTTRLYIDPTFLAPVRRHEALDPALPLILGVSIAATTLPLLELKTLERGDLITLDDHRPESPIGFVSGLPFTYEFRMENGALVFDRQNEDMIDYAHEALDEAELEPLESACLTIVVESARIATTVGELSALLPGSVLALDVPTEGRLTLRIGGKAIARGELVVHEGVPAVRITELATSARAQ